MTEPEGDRLPPRGLLARLEREALAWAFDAALLDPAAEDAEVRSYLERCAAARVKAICLLPGMLPLGRRWREERGGGPELVGVVDFPGGGSPVAEKARQARELLTAGADELDAVLNLELLAAGRYEELRAELAALRDASAGHPLKIIVETPVLEETALQWACELVFSSGAEYLKTATGTRGETTPAQVRQVRSLVGMGLDVKAAGGIRTLVDAGRMLEAGANRLGASRAPEILAEFDAWRASFCQG